MVLRTLSQDEIEARQAALAEAIAREAEARKRAEEEPSAAPLKKPSARSKKKPG